MGFDFLGLFIFLWEDKVGSFIDNLDLSLCVVGVVCFLSLVFK